MRALLLAILYLATPSAAFAAEVLFGDLMAAKTEQVGDKSTVTFLPSLSALNGKTVTIRGWITPINLGDGTAVTDFLLTGTPGTCPFCLGVGPEGFVLISATVPVPADITTELLLSGRFSVDADDPTGFYYRLQQAKVIGHP